MFAKWSRRNTGRTGWTRTAAFAVLLGVSLGHAQRDAEEKDRVVLPKPARSDSGHEMQRLCNTFVGNWQVSETFEVSNELQGRTRQGTASFYAAAGYSLIEQYHSAGSAGELDFLVILWWDDRAQIYRLLTCANNDGCEVRGTARWEGKQLVNSWNETVGGKTATFRDSFVDIAPSSFRLVSEGTLEGKTIWRVVTKYKRTTE